MKSTGIVRKVDELNRIVIPKEICRTFDIKDKTPIEIFVDGNAIVLKKYDPGCVLCGNMDNVYQYNGKKVCTKCRPQ
ncbi:MAG: AbrB/MazE/SpoVT family DNA-binding domain-containing protein [Deltaproteobacteria bacterium]